ncbi:hypothetical protein [Roseivirga pacifica]|uniref:hypothetical protein n=1 Tax=Roseivirga pacifica TaxID=1267423 RepID=UPI003BAACD74
MRTFLLAILACIYLNTQAQDSYPKIKYIDTYDAVFKGMIGYKTPFTMYLKFYAYARKSNASYAVTGWYQTENQVGKTSIAGLYDDDLTVYAFHDSASAQHMLNFETEKTNFWEEMSFYKNLPEYSEKFVFGDSTYNWTNKNDTLNVMLGAHSLDIKDSREFLMFNPSKGFKLDELGDRNWIFDILAHKDNRYILEYAYASKPLYIGMCAAGEESGLLYLEFDELNALTTYQFYDLESCLFDFSSIAEKTANGDIKYITDRGEGKAQSVIIVDTEQVVISRPIN